MADVRWNPWHGCHKVSTGCKNCWMFSMDKKFEKDSNIISLSRTAQWLPLATDRYGDYKHPAGTVFTVCFTSDFFIEEADAWRKDAWYVIRNRSDCIFILLTKRPHRIRECLPVDWGDHGYQNVILATSCENQQYADIRVPEILKIPCLKHAMFCAPLLEEIDLSRYLEAGIDIVNVGGENCFNARPCKYDWVLSMYHQCSEFGNVEFEFWSTGTNFHKDGKCYTIRGTTLQKEQARKSGLVLRRAQQRG